MNLCAKDETNGSSRSCAVGTLGQDAIQELAYGTFGFDEGVAVIHGSGQIAVLEADSAERAVAKCITGTGFAVQTEKESGLRVDEGVPEAVEHDAKREVAGIVLKRFGHDAGDFALGVEAGCSKHIGELFAYAAFIVGERRGRYFGAELTLGASGQPGFGEINEQR